MSVNRVTQARSISPRPHSRNLASPRLSRPGSPLARVAVSAVAAATTIRQRHNLYKRAEQALAESRARLCPSAPDSRSVGESELETPDENRRIDDAQPSMKSAHPPGSPLRKPLLSRNAESPRRAHVASPRPTSPRPASPRSSRSGSPLRAAVGMAAAAAATVLPRRAGGQSDSRSVSPLRAAVGMAAAVVATVHAGKPRPSASDSPSSQRPASKPSSSLRIKHGETTLGSVIGQVGLATFR